MKYLSCKDAGKNCNYIAQGTTDDEVLRNAAEHGKKAHGMRDADFSPDYVKQLRTRIKEESSKHPAP